MTGLADDQMFNVQLGWQSVPVHTQNAEDDIVSQEYCDFVLGYIYLQCMFCGYSF